MKGMMEASCRESSRENEDETENLYWRFEKEMEQAEVTRVLCYCGGSSAPVGFSGDISQILLFRAA
jgi:hypothetical protein